MSETEIPQEKLPSEVRVFNPEGNLVTIPAHQASDAQEMGYRTASPQEANDWINEQKYGGAGQTALTFAEGAARGATFGLSSGIERGLGVDPKDIRNREETNPVASMTGEGAGIVGSSFIPIAGAANVAAHVGEGAASLAAHAIPALGEANLIGKVGSAAVKGAVENAVFATGDEVSKAILHDPNQSFQTAMTDIGLSGLIGGGIGGGVGAVSPLWEATYGPKAKVFLDSIRARANGEVMPIEEGLASAMKGVEDRGIVLPDEYKAAQIHPEFETEYQRLRESGNGPGEALRGGINNTHDAINTDVSNMLGGSEKQLDAHKIGDEFSDALSAKVDATQKAVKELYAEIPKTPGSEAISEPALNNFSEDLVKKGSEGGGSRGGPRQQIFENWAGRVRAQDTVERLESLTAEINVEAQKAWRAGDAITGKALAEVREEIRGFQNQQILDKIKSSGAPNAEEIAKSVSSRMKEARTAHGQAAELFDELRGAAKIKGAKKPWHLDEALASSDSSKLIQNVLKSDNVNGLDTIRRELPDQYEKIVEYKKNDILNKSKNKAGEFQANTALKKIRELPPRLREALFKPEELTALENHEKILASFPQRMNPSGTGVTREYGLKHMFGGAGAMIGMLTGGHGMAGFLAGEGARLLGKDIPDAAKLSLLKFLGSSGPVDASAWKTAADLIEKTYKGQKLIDRATKAVFMGGKAVLPEAMYPDEKKTERLDKKLKELAQNPEPLFNVGGKTGHYMPEHAQAMGETAANAVTWLNQQRPREPQAGLLDSKIPVPQEVADHYTRTLQIAEQPLVALQHLKDGTLQASDVATVQTLYPQLFSKLQQGLVSELINAKSEDHPLPYHMTLGLGLFLSQPLDGTMTPEGIQALQSSSSPQEAQQGPQNQASQAPHGSMKALAQSPGQFMTPGQKRESSHSV